MPPRYRIPVVPVPDRVRRIEGSFGWLDHRLARQGYLERMTLPELAVYVFLVLAADRNGVSFYRKESIAQRLGIAWSEVDEAKARLLDKGLIAFRPFSAHEVDGFFQVLPLPESPDA
jgi:hypothetical protein